MRGLCPCAAWDRSTSCVDPERYTLVGADTDQVFRLGQPLDVVLSRVDVATTRLDLRPLR